MHLIFLLLLLTVILLVMKTKTLMYSKIWKDSHLTTTPTQTKIRVRSNETFLLPPAGLLIAIPALGIGIALQLFIEGPQGDRAYYAMFALAAWLGSTFITEDETDEEEGADAADYDILNLGR